MADASGKAMRVEDLARLVGVSPSTVSKVINGRHDVSDETRERVEKAMNEFGYSKKLVSTKVTQTIEILVPHLQEIAGNRVVEGVISCAEANNVNIGITQVNKKTSTAVMSKVLDRNPLGVIILLYRPLKQEQRLLEIRRIPHVIIGQIGELDSRAMSVSVDNWTAGLTVGQHLLALGHKRFGVISGPSESQAASARFSGFETALKAAKVDIDPSYIRPGNYQPEAGYLAANQLLELPEPPTAIFALNDATALSTYRAAQEHGLSIPKDLSVIGYDDTYPSPYLAPPLTTIRQPFEEIAKAAVQQIIAERDNTVTNRHIIIPARLIVRDSTAVSPR